LDLYSLSLLRLAVRPCHRSHWGLPYAKNLCATLPCETALMTSRLCSRLVGGSFVLPATASPVLKGRLRLAVQAGRAQQWSVSLLAIPLPQRRTYSNLHTWAEFDGRSDLKIRFRCEAVSTLRRAFERLLLGLVPCAEAQTSKCKLSAAGAVGRVWQ
jgi:hypothetical protein